MALHNYLEDQDLPQNDTARISITMHKRTPYLVAEALHLLDRSVAQRRNSRPTICGSPWQLGLKEQTLQRPQLQKPLHVAAVRVGGSYSDAFRCWVLLASCLGPNEALPGPLPLLQPLSLRTVRPPPQMRASLAAALLPPRGTPEDC